MRRSVGGSSVWLAALAAVAGVLLLASPAAAATYDIDLTQSGPKPATRTVAPGDSVRFVNTDTFPHSLASSTSNWSFSFTVQPGQSSPPVPLHAAGTYGYRGTNLDTFTGQVDVTGGPSPSPSAGPSHVRGGSPSPAVSPGRSATPGPTPSGSGSPSPLYIPPPLSGGFLLASGSPSPGAVAPELAPLPVPSGTGSPATPEALGPPSPVAEPTTALAPGRLPGPRNHRRFGLPLALALVGVLGVGSLLARVVLWLSADRP